MRTGALILAAGRSSRMGEFKPLLEIDGSSLLERAVALFKNAGVEEIVTVVGYRAEILIPVLEANSSRYTVNEHYRDGMFSSIQKGVAELKGTCEAFFLLPVDIPCVRASTLTKLLDAFSANPSTLVCYPEFKSKRGHPPLINRSLIDPILAYPGEGDLRGLLRHYDDQAINIPVTDPFVRLDVDTKQDFCRLELERKNSGTE